MVLSFIPPAGGQEDAARLEHLLQAAAHLEQAGLTDQAAGVRAVIQQQDVLARGHLLQQKLRQLSQLQAEVDQLQRAMPESPQVLVRLKLLRFQPGRLRQQGFDLASLRLLLDPECAAPVVDDDGRLVKFLQMLQKEGLLAVLSEPTLVTLDGRTASFFTGGQAAQPESAAGALREFGTRLECTPKIGQDRQLSLSLWLRHTAAPEDAENAAAKEPQRPETRGSFQVKTQVALQSGQTLVLGGMCQRDGQPDEQALLVLITAEILASHLPAAAP
jgi:hypothetical protein